MLDRALTNQHEDTLRVYSCPLPEVYEDSFMAVANPGGHGFQSTLILVGTRLGIDKINCVYEEALLSTLQMPQAVGIAGYVVSAVRPMRTCPNIIRAAAGHPPLSTSWERRANGSFTWIRTTPDQRSCIARIRQRTAEPTWSHVIPDVCAIFT